MDRDHTMSGLENAGWGDGLKMLRDHSAHRLKCLSMDSLLLGPNLRPLT